MTKNCFEVSAASMGVTSQGSAGEISAVALLTLMMRAEAATVAATVTSGSGVAAVHATKAESLPVDDRCEVTFELSPYLKEQLQTVAAAVFNRANADFYRSYKKATGMALGEVGEIVLSREDLRPLAYRALMHESTVVGESIVWDKPFAPRFAESLLQLQKYWDCDFLQKYKDVAGSMSAYSARQLLSKF